MMVGNVNVQESVKCRVNVNLSGYLLPQLWNLEISRTCYEVQYDPTLEIWLTLENVLDFVDKVNFHFIKGNP